MADHIDAELAAFPDPESWDWESAQPYPPNPDAGAVIRVRLAGEGFRAVTRAAHAANMTVAEFVRVAAVTRAVTQPHSELREE
jgi:hypothetical protein